MVHPMAISLNPVWVVKGISRPPKFFVSSQLDKGVGQNMVKTKALMNDKTFYQAVIYPLNNILMV